METSIESFHPKKRVRTILIAKDLIIMAVSLTSLYFLYLILMKLNVLYFCIAALYILKVNFDIFRRLFFRVFLGQVEVNHKKKFINFQYRKGLLGSLNFIEHPLKGLTYQFSLSTSGNVVTYIYDESFKTSTPGTLSQTVDLSTAKESLSFYNHQGALLVEIIEDGMVWNSELIHTLNLRLNNLQKALEK